MINEKFFLRLPQTFKNKFSIYPPLIQEAVEDKDFYVYRNLLTITQEELEDEYLNKVDEDGNPLKVPTPFEHLLSLAYFDKQAEKIITKGFEFFIKQTVSFLFEEKKILIGDIEKLVTQIKSVEQLIFLEEEEYFDFQNAIRESLGENPVELPDPTEHPKIKRMKAKARYRDKIKAKQKNTSLSLGASLAVICCMGIGITPLNVGELSYVAFKSLMEYYQEKESYHLDLDALRAGGDSKKIKPKNWIRNLE